MLPRELFKALAVLVGVLCFVAVLFFTFGYLIGK